MASTDLTNSALAALRPTGQLNLLDDIDKLRHQGIGSILSLPQLVVCGDQSSGKSSVLEAISGVPFPRKDNLCTRFATELILRKSSHESVRVEIVPGQDRLEHERQRFLDFQRSLENFEQLPSLVEEAKAVMGLTGAGRAFSSDVLRIEVSKPSNPHLTVVDLPGLIHSENKTQSKTDIITVSNLVSSYMLSSRSIILAVVTAQNDYANQVVLKRARAVDRHGLRTLGLITKPDTLPPGSDSEASFIQLAQNEDIHFSLGWHVLRNRNYESRHSSASQRDLEEEQFLSQGIWKNLPRSNVGISQLRHRLSKVLLNHIQAELPDLVKEIKESLEDCKRRLAKLGDSRVSKDEKRLFLSRLSQSFTILCKASCDGIYEDAFFGDPLTAAGRSKRIRSIIQNQNLAYEAEIRQNGCRYDIVDAIVIEDYDNNSEDGSSSKRITRPEAVEWARELYTISRGRELPGTFNPLLIGELFRLQSHPWEQITRQHLKTVWSESKSFLELLLSDLTDDETRTALLLYHIDPLMDSILIKANEKLRDLFVDRQRHAITYNHYFTDNVQKARQSRLQKSLKASLERLLPLVECRFEGLHRSAPTDVSTLASSLISETEVDMDTYASNELLDCMIAFYKVSSQDRILIGSANCHRLQ